MPSTNMGQIALIVLLVTGVLSAIFFFLIAPSSPTQTRLQRTETCRFCGDWLAAKAESDTEDSVTKCNRQTSLIGVCGKK